MRVENDVILPQLDGLEVCRILRKEMTEPSKSIIRMGFKLLVFLVRNRGQVFNRDYLLTEPQPNPNRMLTES
ncbi:hypothetical protein M1O47_01265 [Dehalococcoidia bacterium]|nr:hypothetical protein [Dehalococcoidia bacterium]MCL0094117.1 hypothetical protein [Dehalococcoidia bacterium]